MPQLIEIPGQGTVEFPDSMDDDAIKTVIKRKSQSPAELLTSPSPLPGPSPGLQLETTKQFPPPTPSDIAERQLPIEKAGELESPTFMPNQPIARVGSWLMNIAQNAKSDEEFKAKHPVLHEWNEGIKESVAEGIDSLTTPNNLLLMGLGGGAARLGKAAASAVSAGFTYLLAKNLPDIWSQFQNELKKPEGERNQKAIAKLVWTGAMQLAMTGLAGAGTILPLRPGAKPPVIPPETAPTVPRETIVSAAWKDPEGNIHTGANHLEILKNNNVPGFESDESRQTPDFGFWTDQNRFVTRPQAAPIAKNARQQLEPFEKDTSGQEQPGSHQIASRAQPEKAVGEVPQKPDKPPVLPPGMGGASYGEVETGGNPDIYGVAQRVREQRAAAGQVAPIQPGEGIAAADSVERGRQLLQTNPNSADEALSKFEADPQKAVSAEGMAATRAKGEQLAATARAVEEGFGTDSDEYRRARVALSDWDKRVKAMQTEWHKTGQAQQGETDIDTGSFTGLSRAYEQQTGEQLTPEQAGDAKKIAKQSKQANDTAGQAQVNLSEELDRQSGGTLAERRALDAAKRTVRENAIRLANLENKTRVATTVAERETARIQEDAARKTLESSQDKAREAAVRLAEAETVARIKAAETPEDPQTEAAQKALDAATKTARDAAVKLADAENKARTAKAGREKDLAEIQANRARKSAETASRIRREAAVRLAEEERKNLANPERRVWRQAKKYLDQQVETGDSFDDIRNKVATDLGLPVKKVTDLLVQTKRAKYLADEAWKRQQDARRLKEQAKRWLIAQAIPTYQRAAAAIPRVMFGLKVGFHGTVALGTHAPMKAFDPRFWDIYTRDFGKMYRMIKNPAYYEMQVQDLLRRPNYITARRAGLVNDPFTFEDFNSPDTVKYFFDQSGMGNRGYSVLKILRQDLFDREWNNLPEINQTPEFAEAIADGINHATGVVKGKAPRGTNIALFAPRLEASRVMWLAGDPIRAANTLLHWKDATAAERHFAIQQVKEKAIVAGTLFSLLALNQGFLTAIGSDQQINFTNPFKSDFLKFKVAGLNIGYGNAMLSMARLPLRLWVGIRNEGKLNKVVFEDENVAKILFDYARSQASPFAALVLDLAFGRDYQGRPLPRAGFGLLPGRTTMPKRLQAQGAKPYTWPEFTVEQVLPIPAEEAMREVWDSSFGEKKFDVNKVIKALAIISVMGATGARLTDDVQYPGPKNVPGVLPQ